MFFNKPETGNYSPSFNLTSQPPTVVTMKFWRQCSDLNNPFPHKHPPFSAFLRKTFHLLHRSPKRFAIRASRHMAFAHNMVIIIIHKFSIKRPEFLSIFYFRYAIMLMTCKWLHCSPEYTTLSLWTFNIACVDDKIVYNMRRYTITEKTNAAFSKRLSLSWKSTVKIYGITIMTVMKVKKSQKWFHPIWRFPCTSCCRICPSCHYADHQISVCTCQCQNFKSKSLLYFHDS